VAGVRCSPSTGVSPAGSRHGDTSDTSCLAAGLALTKLEERSAKCRGLQSLHPAPKPRATFKLSTRNCSSCKVMSRTKHGMVLQPRMSPAQPARPRSASTSLAGLRCSPGTRPSPKRPRPAAVGRGQRGTMAAQSPHSHGVGPGATGQVPSWPPSSRTRAAAPRSSRLRGLPKVLLQRGKKSPRASKRTGRKPGMDDGKNKTPEDARTERGCSGTR